MCYEYRQDNVTVGLRRDASLRAYEVVVTFADRRDPSREQGIRLICFDNGRIGYVDVEGNTVYSGHALAEGEDIP